MTILNEDQEQIMDEMSSPEKIVELESDWAKDYMKRFMSYGPADNKHDLVGNELHIGDWCLNPHVENQTMLITLVRVISFANKTVRVQYSRSYRSDLYKKYVDSHRLIKIDFNYLKEAMDSK